MMEQTQFKCISALIALCIFSITVMRIQSNYNELQESRLVVQERMHAKDIEMQRLNIGYRE